MQPFVRVIVLIQCYAAAFTATTTLVLKRQDIFQSECYVAELKRSSPFPVKLFAGKSEENKWTLEEMHAECSPLSMTIDELGHRLGGIGRARAVWDCYRVGVDPVLYWDPDANPCTTDGLSPQALLGKSYTRNDVTAILPSKRVSQGLGMPAFQRLKKVTKKVEEGIATLSEINSSSDGTTKLLLKLRKDNLEVESVIIPWKERGRSTLCISSQVGCKQGCRFCATGRMGKLRSLTTDEILCQMYYANKICRLQGIPPVDNVVFMGMGEPADNAENVVHAVKILADRRLFQLSQSKITISTVAPNPNSFRLLATAPATLAWSVHAANDELRKSLVPTTKFTMEELRDGFVQVLKERPQRLRTVMLEVTLIDNVNDSVEAADELATFVHEMISQVPGIKLVVNLIPLNDIGQGKFRKPTHEQVHRFQDILISRGLYAFIRTTRGDDESAACGQLATRATMKTNNEKSN